MKIYETLLSTLLNASVIYASYYTSSCIFRLAMG